MAKPPKKKLSPLNTRGKKTKRTIGDTSKPNLSPEEEARWKSHYAKRKKERQKQTRRLYREDGMAIRTRILHASLYIEKTVGDLVYDLLNITEKGRKEMRFPFERKIGLLFAMDLVTKEERKLLDAFRQVRNCFIHDLSVKNYTDFYTAESRKELKETVEALADEEMRKLPHVAKGNDEKIYDLGTRILTDRVPQICDRVKKDAVERLKEQVAKDIYFLIYSRIHKEIGMPDGPFGRSLSKLNKRIILTYSRAEVEQFLDSVSNEVSDFFVRIGHEEKDKYFKEQRQKRGSGSSASPLTSKGSSKPRGKGSQSS